MNWLFDEARPERDTARDGAADLGAPSSLPCHRPRWPRRASAPASPASRAPPANGQPVSSAPPAGRGKRARRIQLNLKNEPDGCPLLGPGPPPSSSPNTTETPRTRAAPDPSAPAAGGALLEACGQQVRPRRPSRRSGGVTGQCHDLSPWRRMPQASRAHLRRRDRPARTGARPSTRPTLDRAAGAIERAEKAISDLDAEIRTARALLTYATGEWAE